MTKDEIQKEDFFEDTMDDSLSVDEFTSSEGSFIPIPAVGDEVTFKLTKATKEDATVVMNPKTNKNMDIKLSKVDYYYKFHDDTGKTYDCTSWCVLGQTKAIVKLVKKFGFELNIKHVADGRTSKEQPFIVSAKIDGTWKTVDKTGNWAEAQSTL